MANRSCPSRWASRALVLLLLLAGTPRAALALNVCNALLQIDYTSG